MREKGDMLWRAALFASVSCDPYLYLGQAGARRCMGGHLLAWDRRGRVVHVDIDTGAARTLTFG